MDGWLVLLRVVHIPAVVGTGHAISPSGRPAGDRRRRRGVIELA
jgi:hypothetical protein